MSVDPLNLSKYPRYRLLKPALARKQNGLGMIEILVAVLILAIGLLGMASLQVNSLKMTSDSQNRSQAVLLANDIIERARANRENLASYVVAAKSVSCDNTFKLDTSKAVAVNDVAAWQNELACLLPSGQGSVSQSGNIITVTVSWTADTTYSLSLKTEI